MAHIEYKDGLFLWRDSESVYIPFRDESPEYYVVNGLNYYSESLLKKQGFKAKHLKSLGEPDTTLPNRRFPRSGNMRLHLASKVDELFPF